MKIFFSCILILLGLFSSFGQNTVKLKGHILNDMLNSPVEGATVYVVSNIDSSIVAYTISDKNGFFKLEFKSISHNLLLRISSETYSEFVQNIGKLAEGRDLGIIKVKKELNELKEVIIKNDVPIRFKKDTLEFNAPSFKLRPDSNVETLLKRLPGIEIDAYKKITVNGKEVDKILVNGVSFFGEDGKIALQNLPSEIIQKVQVSNTKTKEEEFTKKSSTSNKSTINLTLKEDKNKGVFGKFMGGLGISDRYENNALFSYFNDKSRISVLFSSNNINALGFSMDEVFDNMSGGRNSAMGILTGGTGMGITRTNIAGIQYSDQWSKTMGGNGNYNFNNSDFKNDNKTNERSLLTNGSLFSNSDSKNHKDANSHNVDFNLDYLITPSLKIMVRPRLKTGMGKDLSDFNKFTFNDTNELINKTSSLNSSETVTSNFANDISFFKSFKKNGRFFTVSLQNENSKNDSNLITNSATVFFQGNDNDDIRNQKTALLNNRDKYLVSFKYTEPITDSLDINFNVTSFNEKILEDKNILDFNKDFNSYIDQNELMSNSLTSSKFQITPTAGFSVRRKKFDLAFSAGVNFVNSEFESLYLKNNTDLKKKFIIPEFNIYYNYNISNSKNIYGTYQSEFLLPKGDYFLEIPNLENPLNTVIGNSQLRIQKSHNISLGYQSYDFTSNSGYSGTLRTVYDDGKIVYSSFYDQSGKKISTFANVYGTYQSNLGVNWNKTINRELHKFNFGLYINTLFNLDKGFTNRELFIAKKIEFSPSLNLSYEYGDLLALSPSYSFSYNRIKYENSAISSSSNKLHNFKIETTTYWPKNFVLGNDIGYSYNSNISDGFKKDFYLWNAGLSYKFNNNSMIFKIKIYDILNQNQSTSRTITPISVIDAENTVLKRYLMFSLSYKLQKFAKKIIE